MLSPAPQSDVYKPLLSFQQQPLQIIPYASAQVFRKAIC